MKTFLISTLLLLFLSCSNKAKVPRDVLPQEKMESVLWDMMRADELINLHYSKDTSINRFDSSTRLYQQVFAVHSIDAATFKRSFTFYQSRPDLLKPVFDSLQKRGFPTGADGPTPYVQ